MSRERFSVTKFFRLEARHSLPHLPPGEDGKPHKCSVEHGHSYKIEIECRGYLDERHFVVDYADIKKAWQPFHDLLDHSSIDTAMNPPYRNGEGRLVKMYWTDEGYIPSTAENLAKWIYDRIELDSIYSVTVYETYTTSCTYPVL